MAVTAPTRWLLGALLGAALSAHAPFAAPSQAAKPKKAGASARFHTGVSYLYREDGEPIAFQRVKEGGGSDTS